MIDLGTGSKPSSLASVTLSLDEMQLLVQLLDLAELPTVLRYRSGHDHEDARFRAMEAARSSLTQRELLNGDIVHEDLETRLHAVSRPFWVINTRLFVAGTVSGICAAKGENGVYTVILRGPVSYLVSEVAADELAAAMLAALPQTPPLNFLGMNAPTERLAEILDRVGDPAATAGELVGFGADPQAALTVGRALARTVAHTNVVGIVYGDGTRDIVPTPVAVYDTADGRILVTASVAGDGTGWSSLSSGTHGRVRQAFQELIGLLPDRQQFPTYRRL
jgi:hypothetical protein